MSLHTRLFVGNIPLEANEADMHEAFSCYGEIKNVDFKTKPGAENDEDKKRFAFITLSASNYEIESCIKHFANTELKGHKLYVTLARESFLERLQRERNQTNQKNEEKNTQIKPDKDVLSKANPVINLSAKLNPQKRKIDSFNEKHMNKIRENIKIQKHNINMEADIHHSNFTETYNNHEINDKKQNSEKKRLESLKKKRQEFKEKKMIIKTGLIGIDKVPNKKVIFSDNEDNVIDHVNVDQNNAEIKSNGKKSTLFDDDESDSEVNFEVKTQFEGKKGQKVLDLQSRYKSDKRFTLDERFVDDDQSADENEPKRDDEEVDVGQTNETLKQLNILQDVLGVSIKMNHSDHVQKTKPKLGMLRYDPMHPDHAKFLAPTTTTTQEAPKKVKKKKSAAEVLEAPITEEPKVIEKIEVSKEQFYKVTDTLKEAMIQPSSFSLRNLFPTKQNDDEEKEEQNNAYVPLPKDKEKRSKNPFDTGDKNPFIYDSSDSECEDNKEEIPKPIENTEKKAVWRENLFFSKDDHRLKEGLLYFTINDNEAERQKERRGLKSVMKKRIYNKDRKSQMFQKKIGGRKKSMKKSIKGKR